MTNETINMAEGSGFADELLAEAQSNQRKLPWAWFDREGDCIEFLLERSNYYAKRIDQYVTIYLSEEDDHPIGMLMKNVEQFISHVEKKFPGTRTDLRGQVLSVEYLITAYLWSSNNENGVNLLFRFRDVAKDSELRLDQEAAC